MTAVAGGMFGVLTAIAAAHAAWGCGVVWPRQNEADLVVTVVGYERARMPPPAQCFVVALLIFIPGVVALALAGVVRVPAPSWLVTAAGVVAAAVFAGRGVAGYLPAFRAHFPREPFASLDRRYYSPLCILLAAGFSLLLFDRMKG